MKYIVILETEGNVSVLTEVFKCRYNVLEKLKTAYTMIFFPINHKAL